MKRVNPLRTLRESAGLSIAGLAEQAAISPQAITRAEQGVYASPPPALLDALWELAPEDDLHDYGIFMADYHNFQRLVRQDNYGELDPDFDFSQWGPQITALTHPFVQWRTFSEVSARIAISKMYCVHPALIFKFEAQPYLCATVPKELIRALTESGYDRTLLHGLETAYGVYRESRKTSSNE